MLIKDGDALKKSFFVSIVFSSLFIYYLFVIPQTSAQYSSDGQDFFLAGPINIISPANITYNSNDLTLKVTTLYLLGPEHASFSYSLDGANNVTITLTGIQEPREVTRTYANGTIVIVNSTLNVPFTLNGEQTLLGLSKGPHHIVVYAKYIANEIIGHGESNVNFISITNQKLHLSQSLLHGQFCLYY